MTTTQTLADFLLARIAEDEAAAEYSTAMWTSMPSTSRVLAECEAKRRIVEELTVARRERVPAQRSGVYDVAEVRDMRSDGDADMVLPLLALPYSDHPDYREEWRP